MLEIDTGPRENVSVDFVGKENVLAVGTCDRVCQIRVRE